MGITMMMGRRSACFLGSPLFTLLLLLDISCVCNGAVPAGCNGLLDLVFVVDESESIRDDDPIDQPGYNWNLLKQFVKGVISDMPVGAQTQVAMVKYSTRANVEWHLGFHDHAYDLVMAVDGLQHLGGNTNTAEALEHVRESVFKHNDTSRHGARRVVVLLTDGLSTVRSDDVPDEGRRMRAAGAEVYVVSVGRYTDEAELRSLVEDFSKNIVKVNDFERLATIQKLLVHRLCDLPDPQPDDKSPTECKKMDLAFLVDNSGSIEDKGKGNYGLLKNFISNIVHALDVGTDETHIGVVRFSETAELEFRLSKYNDKESIRKHINQMTFRGSYTNTASAIRLTMDKLFNNNPAFGDRPGVPNVGIIITDGKNTREMNETIPEAMRAKRGGVQLFVVGVTNDINVDELKNIASRPVEDHYFEVTKIRYLNPLRDEIIKNICHSIN